MKVDQSDEEDTILCRHQLAKCKHALLCHPRGNGVVIRPALETQIKKKVTTECDMVEQTTEKVELDNKRKR